ncbi:hypothetical protein ATCC90586_000611 [Pythium insidiosum]|nr:hypothetical protein ATCC90586_000611 [Pythium insidiosum]
MEKQSEALTKTQSTSQRPLEAKCSLQSLSGSLPILNTSRGLSTNIAMLGDDTRPSGDDAFEFEDQRSMGGHASAPGRLYGDDIDEWMLTETPLPLTAPAPAVAPTRYVAGNEFFNYSTFGSLRPGGSVSLWSKAYVGYAIAAFASAGLVNNGWPALSLTKDAVLLDLPVTRRTAFYGVLVTTGAVLFTLVWLRLLPRQKLDAQQLRVYGGYSKLPVTLLSIAYLVGFPYVTYLQVSRLGR